MSFVFNTLGITENSVFAAFSVLCSLFFVLMDICQRGKIRAKKVPFCARRGGSLLFIPFARFFVFRLLVIASRSFGFLFFVFVVWCFFRFSSLFVFPFGICLFLSFVCCPFCFPFLCFPFPFPFVRCFLYFLSLLCYSCPSCMLYNNIINKISIISFVCAYVHTRTTKQR